MNWNDFQYFNEYEFACKCGHCPGSIHPPMVMEYVFKLDTLRGFLGHSISLTSGYRCPAYNDRVSGTGLDGPHTTGQAADLNLNRGRAYAALEFLVAIGFTGVGFDQTGDGRFIHLDDLTQAQANPRPTVWSY